MEHEPRPLANAPYLGEHNVQTERPLSKCCAYCGEWKPLADFKRRSGRRAGATGRRGACRACRESGRAADAPAPLAASTAAAPSGSAAPQPAAAGPGAAALTAAAVEAAPPAKRRRRRRKRSGAKAAAAAALAPGGEAPAPGAPAARLVRRIRRPLPAAPPRPDGPDASVLRPTRSGVIKMRGKTDKGRRWVQETDLETAVNLVREHAAIVVNKHTIRRLYSNKAFRNYVLTRDGYTCYFCGEYGDTIDHLVPRAKGGHTTPMNCVCACQLCNQSKADRNLDDFVPL